MFIENLTNNDMPNTIFKQNSHIVIKRGVFNVGGSEYNPEVVGDDNVINIGIDPLKVDQETLLRKGIHEIGRVLQAGGDLVTAPVKWLSHMQENWYGFHSTITLIRLRKSSRFGVRDIRSVIINEWR